MKWLLEEEGKAEDELKSVDKKKRRLQKLIKLVYIAPINVFL